MLKLKRAYDEPAPEDDYRVLVDRLWPRGLSKERARIDSWMKDIAPTTELRKWFAHDPDRFAEFSARYSDELAHNSDVEALRDLLARHPTVTLVYAAKDIRINHAVVLQDFIEHR